MRNVEKGRARGGLVAALAGVGTALLSSACCIGPAVLALAGAGGAGLAAGLEPLRPYFLGMSAIFLSVGFYLAYRRREAEACPTGGNCASPDRRRGMRIGLWIAAFIAVGAAAYPYFGAASVSDSPVELVQGAQLFEFKVEGMTCRSCATHVGKALDGVPGVESSRVDFESGKAEVQVIGEDFSRDALFAAVRTAGYRAEAIQGESHE